MPNITVKIVSVWILLKNGDEIEANLVIKNIKYKGTITKFIMSSKDGLYYLHASIIQHKPGMIVMIYEINDDKKLMDTE